MKFSDVGKQFNKACKRLILPVLVASGVMMGNNKQMQEEIDRQARNRQNPKHPPHL